ncbi:MAG: hypothetical protein QOF19_508 [Alphaproteobacteria bacterium]|nr:hypothetical protein [Alphaproteobacteria bacterium]
MNVHYQPVEITAAEAALIAHANTLVVPNRECGTCTLCCKVVHIEVLASPAGQWCPHCRPGKGCGIYTTRPAVCRGAYCEWMISRGLGPEWKPEKAKFVLFKSNDGRRLTAHVDPGYPSAWRASPYYENFKIWAAQAAQKTPEMHMVDVMIGEHVIVVLPDRDVDVGLVAADELVLLGKRATPTGEFIEVHKIKREAAPA